MTVYICSVSPRFPENYLIGVKAGLWGVEDRYKGKLDFVMPGSYKVSIDLV